MAETDAPQSSEFVGLMAEGNFRVFDCITEVKHVAMTPVDNPRVELPDCSLCAPCSLADDSNSPALAEPSPEDFADMVVTGDTGVAKAPPKLLIGMGLANGPHVRVKPSRSDLACIVDPSDLAWALWANRVWPSCACARALFAAADADCFGAYWLDALRLEYEASLLPEPPPRPKPKKFHRLDIGGLNVAGDLFAAFGIKID